jgi:hypothetical protein
VRDPIGCQMKKAEISPRQAALSDARAVRYACRPPVPVQPGTPENIMIRVVMFDLGETLVDANRRPFPHVREALTALGGFRTADSGPLSSCLVSDYTMVVPPITRDKIRPVFEEYIAILDATALREFFEPEDERVTLSTHVGVGKPDRAVFEMALHRLRSKATLQECLFITENAGHPRTVKLPVVTGTNGSKPAIAAQPLIPGKSDSRRDLLSVAIGVPDATTGTAENVEAGPARGRRHHRSLGVGTGRKVSRRGRSGEGRERGQGDD